MIYRAAMQHQWNDSPQHYDHVTLRRVLALFRPYRLHVASQLLCTIVNAALSVVPTFLISQIIDQGIIGRNVGLLFALSGFTLGLVIANGLIGVLRTYLATLIGQRVMADLRVTLYQHLLALSLRFFSKAKLGDLMSRFNNDIGGVQGTITGTFSTSISNFLTLVVTLIFMFAFNWPLTLVALVVVPAFIVPTRRVGRTRRKLSLDTQETQSRLNTVLGETLNISGLLLVKNFVRQEAEQARFADASADLMRLQIRQSMVGRWLFMFVGVFAALGPVLICLVGGLEALGFIPGHITLGIIVAFVALLNRLYSPVTQLANVWVDIQGSASLFERIFELLDEPRDIADKPGAPALPPVRGEIIFEQVNFRYLPDRLALRDVSFVVEPGQLVALVGPSGAGKSTTTYLIPRLYDVSAGSVRIDGHDVREVQLYSLGKQIGMVTQETYLFHATLRENIAYGRPGASEGEMIAAAKAANIHDFIMGLPEGYNTVVGERGYKLSGGEKQRIAIARVILKNPRILILDEATSSLDSRSEALIQAALLPLMQQRTTVVIAHRLSTILAADQILVFDQGQIVERGNHLELLGRSGLYARLYHEQFKAETERLAAVSEERS